MRHRLTLLLMCIVLHTSTTVVKLEPQKIERVTEYRWCTTIDGFRIERVVWMRVDAKNTEPTHEPLVLQQERRPAEEIDGP